MSILEIALVSLLIIAFLVLFINEILYCYKERKQYREREVLKLFYLKGIYENDNLRISCLKDIADTLKEGLK